MRSQMKAAPAYNTAFSAGATKLSVIKNGDM
jgi:hypothetical protein